MIRLARPSRVMLGRMAKFWVYGTGPAALLLLLLAPAILPDRPATFVLTYLALPAYMLHQVEEFDAGLVRRSRGVLGLDQVRLRLGQVALINLGFGWLPLAVTLWLVVQSDSGWVVLAAWLVMVNAGLHLAQAAVQGVYNPGLGTALVLLGPLAAAVFSRIEATGWQHGVSIATVAALHVFTFLVARGARPSPS